MGRHVRNAALAALPGLTLGAAGLLHPHHLTTDTADTWFQLHLAGMFVFPLVGWALVLPLAGRRDPAAWLARLAGYGYAVAYTALDVISGVTAGYVTSRLPDGSSRPEEVSWMFRIGTPVGEVGSWALVVAAVVVLLASLARHRLWALPLLVLPAGAWAVHLDHIFAPTGVAGMLLLGLGSAYAVLVAGRTARPEVRHRRHAAAS